MAFFQGPLNGQQLLVLYTISLLCGYISWRRNWVQFLVYISQREDGSYTHIRGNHLHNEGLTSIWMEKDGSGGEE